MDPPSAGGAGDGGELPDQVGGPGPGAFGLAGFERSLAVVLDEEALGPGNDLVAVRAQPTSDTRGGAAGQPGTDAGVEGCGEAPVPRLGQAVEPVPDAWPLRLGL